MASLVANRALASLVNFGDLGNPYEAWSLGSVLAMGFYGLYDVCLMLGARTVWICCESMLFPSASEGQAKCDFDDVIVQNCKLMRWIEPCLSLQLALSIVDAPSVEEYASFIRSSDDKGSMGNPDTSVRYISSDVDKWLIVAKNKDEDHDEDNEDDNEEDEDDEGGAEGPEGDEEGLEGEGSDDEEDNEDDDDGSGGEGNGDDENGKEGDEDGEEEDGVENEHDENDDEGDDEERDDEDSDEEPPKKRRK